MFKLNKLSGAVMLAVSASFLVAACGGGSGGSEGANSPFAPAPGASLPAVDAEPLRSVKALNAGWKFIQDDSLTDEQALAASAANWGEVRLPHTWNASDAATTAQSTPSTQLYKRGIGWYRLEIDGNAVSGPNKWLQFDAASIVADVWLNGQKLGQHKGAFTAFRFDVSAALKPGKNVILVKTDNRRPASNADATAIAPLSGDFNMSGGLYRGVSLIGTPAAANIALGDMGGSGVYARTVKLEGRKASVSVQTKLENTLAAEAQYRVVASLVEAGGQVKATVSKAVSLKPKEQAGVTNELEVADAHLWQGLADPYLYKLVVELKAADGATVDKVVQDFGVREMRFDANQGFFLNGVKTPLHGVNLHQDDLGKGWAITQEDTDRSFELIKEVGANTLRMAHYPHSDYAVQKADKLGLVVWAELPLVNATSVAAGVDPETTGFAENARLQLKELIRQKFNNASVGIWSIANEVQGGDNTANNVQALFKSLNAVAKAEDPGRITTLANQINRSGDVIRPDAITLTGITDSFSVNRYFQWYYGTSETQLGENLDQIHASTPSQPIGVSEYGAGSAMTHHTDNVAAGRVCSSDTSGLTRICYQPEGYANYVHEKAYGQMVQRPYLMGTWIWNMFDFGSGNRHEGDIGQTNTKGIVTFGRDVKKDAFYFYKANWSADPVTYIAERRHTERAYTTGKVKVYSNATSTALQLNGVEVARKSAAECPLKVCDFGEVKLNPGNNALSAVGVHAGGNVSDQVNWNLPADNASNVYIASGQLTTGFRSTDALLGNHMFGSDNYFVGGELPPLTGRSNVGLSGAIAINGLGSSVIPETGRVWDMWREGASFSYRIPVANGSYKVTLGFLEPAATAANARVFSVAAQGVPVVSNLDIYQATGARNTVTARSFNAVVSDGVLTLDFTGSTGKAIVSNISVVRQ